MKSNKCGRVVTLQDALLSESIDDIKRILYEKHGAKVSSQNLNDQCKEIVNICLDKKLDVNLPGDDYSTLLHFGSKQLDVETFKVIMVRSNVFNINAICKSALIRPIALIHLIILERKENLVQFLINYGADVNVRDFNNQTPLFYAAQRGLKKTVETLLKAGCDVNAVDSTGKMVINYLFSPNDENRNGNELRYLFFDYYNDKKLEFIEIIQLLCEYGVNVNFENKGGNSLLESACGKGLLKQVLFLIKNGANLLTYEDLKKGTPLHPAIKGGNFDLVDFLLSTGLDINAKNIFRSSPLCSIINDLPKEYKKVKHIVDMIEFLADNGANVNMPDISGDTPLQISISNNFPEIMECLLELDADIYKTDLYHSHGLDSFRSMGKTNYCIEMLKLFFAFFIAKKDDITEYIHSFLEKDIRLLRPFFHTFNFEVYQMKITQICDDVNLSYYDFLFKDLKEVAVFCRNEKLIHALESGVYKEKFFCYKFFLEKRFERAQKLKHCMEVFTQFLNKFLKKNEVADKIICFLKIGDVRNMARALHAFPYIQFEK